MPVRYYNFSMQEVLSIKVSSEEKARLRKLADAQNLSLSGLLRKGLQAATAAGFPEASCYDLCARYFESPDGIGSSGMRDLSTNKARLKNFGRKS